MIVKPTGPANAKIAIVGEAPGRDEERLGMPFVGGSGKVLNKMLEEAGIDRGDCYITNVMHERPVNNDFGEFYEDASRKVPSKLLKEGYNRLIDELHDVKPNVVIALGNEAMKALTGKTGITKYRGSILQMAATDTPGVMKQTIFGEHYVTPPKLYMLKIIPTLHPAAIMRQWENRPLAVMDLKRAKEVAEDTTLFPLSLPSERVWVKVEDLHHLKIYVDDYLKYASYISFDIETCNNQISCIGFAKDATHSFTVPICMFDKSYWTDEEELKVWLQIKRLLESDIPKIAQNANFDMFYLKSTVDIEVQNLWMDTMIAHHCVYPELPKSLATLCSIYTREPYYKDMIGEDIYHYNCLDAMITYECAMALEKEMAEFGVDEFYHRFIHHLIPILLNMQLRGVRIDTKKRALAAEDLKKTMEENQKELNDAVGHELNVNSPKQMADFLYTELGLPIQSHRKTGKTSTNETALKALAKFTPNPLFNTILNIREIKKLISTYLEAEIDPDGRFRCSYLLSGTESGRLASRMSATGTGGNLQNVPKGIAREVFIPDEGMMFMAADLSQAEARVVAYLAKDKGLIEIFESGEDIHTQVAAAIFNKKIKDVTKEERELAKRITHASNYGMGARHFGELTGLSTADAQEKLNAYHIRYPGIRIWHMEVARELKRSRILTTPMGRKRMFFGRWNDALLRDGYSYIPQSTVADVVLKGMVNIVHCLPDGCSMVFNIHDEVVIQMPIKYKDKIVCDFTHYNGTHFTMEELMIHCMSIPLEIHGRTLTIPVNVKSGTNWNEVS